MRDAGIAIKTITPRGEGIPEAAERVHFQVVYGGPQQVFVDDRLRVFSHAAGTLDALRMERNHADWLIGTYFAGTGIGPAELRRVIIGDLRERVAELRRLAA